MSLKTFHIFFIATVLGLMAFACYWSLPRAAAGEGFGLLAASIAGLLAALGYLRWFAREHRSLR